MSVSKIIRCRPLKSMIAVRISFGLLTYLRFGDSRIFHDVCVRRSNTTFRQQHVKLYKTVKILQSVFNSTNCLGTFDS
jgi:hypothetical protein